jgi:hypothetical protein
MNTFVCLLGWPTPLPSIKEQLTLHFNLKSKRELPYLDDVLIPSTTVKKGLANLRKVLTTLQSHGFSINVEKCSFLQTEVEYLGRVISNGEVKPNPSKANVLKAIKPPMNVKEVRQFLGLAGYFGKINSGIFCKNACFIDTFKI